MPKSLSKISKDILDYNKKQSGETKKICSKLAEEINSELENTENKIWHRTAVWFEEGNPLVGYAKRKNDVQLLFWSGQSFEEKDLEKEGSFKAAGIRYIEVSEINVKDLKRWLKKAKKIQWDYKNIVKRKGKLIRLK